MHSIHRSIDYDRVEYDRAHGREKSLEVALADAWEEENVPQPGLNQGHGVLQDLMFGRPDYLGQAQCRLIITRRDAAVAATAIQWLGTNCGSAWLSDAVKRAGWLLLFPGEAAHYQALEEDMRRREERVRLREIEAKKREADMFEQREARLQARLVEVQKREADLDEREFDLEKREQRLEEGKAGFIATMMLANLRAFRRTEPTTAKKRQVALSDD